MQIFESAKLQLIRTRLVKKGETVAVGESVTAGMLQLSLSEAEFASQFFQGGITAYNLGQKVKLLNIEPIHAEACNCVSPQVAAELAKGVAVLFGCQWGIGVTGFATPVPESDNKIFAHYSIYKNGKPKKSGKLNGKGKNPFEVQVYYVQRILDEFLRQLV
jgi:PncC family amidohydrolase